jgi:thiol-disulfide isomerase/thioredoxin
MSIEPIGIATMRRIALAAALFLAAAAPLPPPTLPPGKIPPIAKPYDVDADAHAAVDAAFARAKLNHHNVLLDFGGNWCGDCRALAGVLEQPDVAKWVSQHYETVNINVGRFTVNTDIAKRFGVTLKAAPTVLVVAPNGTVLNADRVEALADARYMSPQAVVDLLSTWVS